MLNRRNEELRDIRYNRAISELTSLSPWERVDLLKYLETSGCAEAGVVSNAAITKDEFKKIRDIMIADRGNLGRTIAPDYVDSFPPSMVPPPPPAPESLPVDEELRELEMKKWETQCNEAENAKIDLKSLHKWATNNLEWNFLTEKELMRRAKDILFKARNAEMKGDMKKAAEIGLVALRLEGVRTRRMDSEIAVIRRREKEVEEERRRKREEALKTRYAHLVNPERCDSFTHSFIAEVEQVDPFTGDKKMVTRLKKETVVIR